VSSSTGNVRCNAYTGANGESAATIIFKVQQACGISAKVILVTLQKEQGLITKTAPSQAALDRAMGFACPDTAACDTNYYGFFNQVYAGALQLNTYKASRFGRQPGVQAILTHPPIPQPAPKPPLDCPSLTVNVVNYATAALYNYTPYTPDAGALANLSGMGGQCSSYGNRNFWVYYNNWFGSPTGNPMGAVQAVTVANNAVTVTGWALDPDVPTWAATVRVRGTGWSQTLSAAGSNTAAGTAFPGAGNLHGFAVTLPASVGTQWVCVDALNYGLGADVTLGCSSVTVPTALTTTRIQGTDRYNTAVQVSQQTAPVVPVVYVASGDSYPDALSAAPAAAKQGVPLLLVTRDSIPQSVLTELARLRPQTIVAVGGTSVVSDAVLQQLNTFAPATRLQGTDRYNTSIQVGGILGAHHSGKVYLATGANFPDALSAAAAAGYQDAPLLLVDGSTGTISPALASALSSWGVTQVTIVGGTSVMTAQFAAAVATIPGVTSVPRIAGTDRYSTSAAVNSAAFPNPTGAFMSVGTDFPDALSGGALAGKQGKPLYLVPGPCVSSGALAKLVAAGPINVTLLGGTSALTQGAATFTPCG
jgi:putative cell wall-binding protein